MSVRDAMRDAMYDRLESYFPTNYGSVVPIGLENHRFEQPKDTPHLQAWFRYFPSKRASIGTVRKYDRLKGIFIVSCYVPEKSGAGVLWRMADAVIDSLEADTFEIEGCNYVTTLVPYTTTNSTIDGLYTTSVFVPFSIDTAPRR